MNEIILNEGMKVTISFNHETIRDRSYQTDVWVVMAINKTHVQLQTCQYGKKDMQKTIVILRKEYLIIRADNFKLNC